MTYRRIAIAEFVGTFAIVFVGSGSLMMSTKSLSQASLLAAGLAYAMTLAGVIAALMNISAHFNPAITLSFVATKRTKPLDGVVKIAAQLIGAVVGAYLLKETFPADIATTTRLGGTQMSLDVTFTSGVLLEAVTTAILAITVCGLAAAGARPPATGIVVGFIVGALIMCIGPLTGASFNPARSFGPALMSGIWEGHLAYWIGPIVGAVVGTVLWDFGLAERKKA
jgi:aquaporin TIP